MLLCVSLFTREWIEIPTIYSIMHEKYIVSLFTREWIEILSDYLPKRDDLMSPSLRGSGLKFPLPTFGRYCTGSPSLRGSGLKCQVRPILALLPLRLPLYEGVD